MNKQLLYKLTMSDELRRGLEYRSLFFEQNFRTADIRHMKISTYQNHRPYVSKEIITTISNEFQFSNIISSLN